MSNEILTADMGFVWVQPDGPNTEIKPLGCHDVGDIAQPQGDITLRYCPDPAGPGKWKTGVRTQSPPGEVTTTLTTYVKKVADWMQKYRNCGAIYIHQSSCGRKDVFGNYDAGNLLYDSITTNKTKTNTAMRETSDASEQSFDVSAAPPLSEYWKLQHTGMTTTEAAVLNDIAICGEDYCAGACGPNSAKCDDLCAVAANVGVATPDMVCTSDGGNVWTIGATDPFAVSEGIAFVVCFPVNRGVVRRLVGCGTTAAGVPRVAYSDDSGATWSADITVPGAAADFFIGGGSGFAIDQRNIWVVDDGGDIFKSEDGGLTWTEQVTANVLQLNYVHFADELTGLTVGNTNAIYSTVDGGEHWTAVVGPVAMAAVHAGCCHVLDRYRWWVGYAGGNRLYYTNDAGATWNLRTLPNPAGAVTVDSIVDIDFYNHYHGVVAVDWTGTAAANRASYYRTVNGGRDWEIIDIPDDFDAAVTIKSVVMCDENLIYGVGGLLGAVAYIGVVKP